MDPGTVLAVVGTILTVGQIIWDTASNFAQDGRQVDSSLTEVKSLNELLERFSGLLKSKDYQDVVARFWGDQHRSSALETALHVYLRQLRVVSDELSPNDKSKADRLWHRLERALKNKHLRDSLDSVRHLCEQLVSQVNIDGAAIAATNHDMLNEVQQRLEEQRVYLEGDKRRKILDWICETDEWRNAHQNISERRHPGTCSWLFARDDFLDWRNGLETPLNAVEGENVRVPSVFWGWGKPGAGKSVIASAVFDHLKSAFSRDTEVFVGQIYCIRKEESPQTCTELIGSLLKQAVFVFGDRVPVEVEQQYRFHGNGSSKMLLAASVDLLKQLLSYFRRSLLVVDGLDEYYDASLTQQPNVSSPLLERLLEIVNAPGSTARLFLTSRTPTMIQEMQNLHPFATTVEITANRDDVEACLRTRIVDPKWFLMAKKLQEDRKLCEEVVTTLANTSQGVFLLPQLALNSLGREITKGDVKSKFRSMPKDIHEYYDAAIARLKSNSLGGGKLGLRLLAWMVHVVRDLTLSELDHAFATDPDRADFDEDYLIGAETFQSACEGLLEVRRGIVQPFHRTVIECLKDRHSEEEWMKNTHRDISETCFHYLSMRDLEDPCPDYAWKERQRQFPLLSYIIEHFGHHASKVIAQDQHVRDKYLGFVDVPALFAGPGEDTSGNLEAASDLRNHNCMSLGALQAFASRILHNLNPERIITLEMPKLHLAILCSLDGLAKYLVQTKEADLEQFGHKWQTALHLAARNSSADLVQFFMEQHADVQKINYSGKNALDMVMNEQFLAFKNMISQFSREEEIWKMLVTPLTAEFGGLERAHGDGNIDKQKPEMHLRVIFTIETQRKTLKMLRDERPPIEKEVALFRLSRLVDGEMTRLILDKKFILDIARDRERAQKCEQVARLLTEHGADLNSLTFSDATPLQLAVLYRRVSLVEYFLKHGANPFLRKDIGLTPLEMAQRRSSGKEDDAMIKILEKSMEDLQTQETKLNDVAAKLEIPGPMQAEDLDKRLQSDEVIKASVERFNQHGEDVARRMDRLNLQNQKIEHAFDFPVRRSAQHSGTLQQDVAQKRTDEAKSSITPERASMAQG